MQAPELLVVRIPSGSESLLSEIVVARAHELLPTLVVAQDMRLTGSQVNRLLDALADELAEFGYADEKYTLTERGSGVDDLITAFSNARTLTQMKRAARRSALFGGIFVLVVLLTTMWLLIRNAL